MVIVKGKDIFVPVSFPVLSGAGCHLAGGRARVIERFRQRFGPPVEFDVVGRFVGARPLNDDRRVVPVAQDHVFHVANQQFLPGFVPAIPPAGQIGRCRLVQDSQCVSP